MFATVGALTALSLLAARVGAQDSTPTTIASLHSTNPTAVPLTSINSAFTGQPTVSLSQPATVGATPPISGAPALPSWAYSPTLGFPALDQVPPINSSEVQQWIAEVKATGIQIPNIGLSVDGSCGSDPAKAANQSICWWTCGGCTRDTDVTTCPEKNTWGLTYDDGPSQYSTDLLNYLDANSLKTTWFIVGSRAISRPDILQAEYMSGHQLAVHTWSHPYLTTLSNEQIIAELGWTKKAIKDITGLTPNYFRPPYGDMDDRVRAIIKAMGMTPVMWSNIGSNYFDTDDWHIPAGYPVQAVIDNFENILNNASTMSTGFIVLEHDLYPQTVDLAIGYILPDAMARGDITFKNVINCLGKPIEDAYIETNNNSTNPPGDGATTIITTASTTSGTGKSTGKSSSTAKQTGNGGQASPSTSNSSGAAGRGFEVNAQAVYGVVAAAVAGVAGVAAVAL